MAELAASLTFRYWVALLVVLYLKMMANSTVQGVYRLRHKRYTRPDDAAFFGRGVAVRSEDVPIVQRASAIWRNDLENIPIFLFVALAYTLAGGPSGPALLYFGLFTVARLAHMIFYLRPTQPWRHLAYQAGVFTTLITAVHTLYLLFG